MRSIEFTDVLIVGGGPVGLSAALDLKSRNVNWMLINESKETAQHPKCNTTNSRSMEHFRRLGISQKIRFAGLPAELERASAYVTNFCGIEFGRLPRPYSQFATPEVANQISQIVLERELLHLINDAKRSNVHFGFRLIKLLPQVHSEFSICAEVIDSEGNLHIIHSKYLIGADGASSWVRKFLQISMCGSDGSKHLAFMGGTMLSYYIRSPDLFARSKRKPCHSTWIINHKNRGLMFSQDAKQTWVVHYQVPANVDWKSLDPKKIVSKLLFGDDEKVVNRCEFEIISGGPWTGGLALVADSYQKGPIFIAGDAAHLYTPLGGLGMNTGIGDVMNLCWKIAATLQGWGGPNLLKSYELERRPIGVRNSAFGVHCANVMDGWKPSNNFESANDLAMDERKKLGAKVMKEDSVQYLTEGIQLGECYEASPVICHDGSPPPPDRWDRYLALVRPGARAPHFWVQDQVSIYDHFGPNFTLLSFGEPELSEPLLEAANDLQVPIKLVQCQNMNSQGLYHQSLCLIRPDQHIAWVGDKTDLKTAIQIIQKISGVE